MNYVTGTSSDHKRPLDLSMNEATEPLPNIFTSTSQCSGDKRQKTCNSCEIHGKKHQKCDHTMKEAIRKWQLTNIAKCVFENTVNSVLESMAEETISSRQETLNIAAHNFNFENEAVLMAIEEHGLRQQNSLCSCNESDNSEADSSCCSGSDSSDRINSTSSSNAISTYFPNDENPEFNFENNFLATAVSAAIEEKGLSMHLV